MSPSHKSDNNESLEPYSDETFVKIWHKLIVNDDLRKQSYKEFLIPFLRKNNCKRILDVACGVGTDSIILLEEGFDVVSVDASIQMLVYAYKSRWERRKEKAFDNWIIEKANMLTLERDIKPLIGDGFDVVLCLGNSFAHILDCHGDQREQRQILMNFKRCIKPNGFLIIDHRNYNTIYENGLLPKQGLYYNYSKHLKKIDTSISYKNGKPSKLTCDYFVTPNKSDDNTKSSEEQVNKFRFRSYPHMLKDFTEILKETFKQSVVHEIYGDYKMLEETKNPVFYIHIVKKNQ